MENTRSDGAGAESPLPPFLQALLDYSMAIRIDSKTAVSRLSPLLPLTRTNVPLSAPPAAPSVVKPRRHPPPPLVLSGHAASLTPY